MKTQDMDRNWIETAETLSSALPYMQRYSGATVVIKLGGHAMGKFRTRCCFDAASGRKPRHRSWRWPNDQRHA
jgi:hypothetical protein